MTALAPETTPSALPAPDVASVSAGTPDEDAVLTLALQHLSSYLPTLPMRQRVAAALATTGDGRAQALRATLEIVRAQLPTLYLKQQAQAALTRAA